MLVASEWNEPLLNGAKGQSGFLGMAACVAYCASMGFIAARRKDWKAHGKWMMRCFGAMVGGFAIFRLTALLLSKFLPMPWLWTLCTWSSWGVGVAGAELYMKRADARSAAYQKVLEQHVKKEG